MTYMIDARSWSVEGNTAQCDLGCSSCFIFILFLDQFIESKKKKKKNRKRHPHIMLIRVMFGMRLFVKIKKTYVSLSNFGISSI